MQPFEALLVLAEITTAFAGFSGVIAALGKDWDWDDKARFRFQNLLAISLCTILLCLLPIALNFYALSQWYIWTISSVAMALFAFGFFIFRAPIARRLISTDPDDRAGNAVGRTFLITLSATVVLLGLGATSVVNQVAAYVSGLVAYLVLSGLQFVLLVTRATKESVR